MKESIKQLEQSKKWIERALSLIQEDKVERYLEYFKLGYVSGTWHLPTIITAPNHDIHHRLALLLNDQLQGTGFYVDAEEAFDKGNLSIHFEQQYICSINLFKGSIHGPIDYQFQLENYQKKNRRLFENIEKMERLKEESEKWLRDNDRPIKGLFTQKKERKHKEMLLYLDEKMRKENDSAKKTKAIFDSKISTCKVIIDALPRLLAVMSKYEITTEGFLNINRKRYSFYQLINVDEKKIESYISINNEGGIYWVDSSIAFSEHFLKRFEIEDIRDKMALKPYEIFQPNFFRLLHQQDDLGISIENVMFKGLKDAIPGYLQTKLNEALNKKREGELYRAAKAIHNEGYDISEVHFKYCGVDVIFDRYADISIIGESIENEKILNSRPIRMLLGMK